MVQVMNHLNESVVLYWSEDGEIPSASEIDSVRSGQTLAVPFSCFDNPQGGFFLKPDVPK